MCSLQALLFDVDGTLAETEEGHRRAFNAAFAAAGLDWHWSPRQYRELLAVTGGKERIRHYIDTAGLAAGLPTDLDRFIAELHALKTRYYTEAVRTGNMGLRPGVARLIGEARAAGLRLAVATTTSPANVEALLQATLGPEAIGWFDAIAAGGVVPAKKPAPDIYHHALDRLGLPPDACLALEDSRNGLRAARAAGVPCLVTPSFYTDHEHFDGAVLVVSDLGEPDRPFRLIQGDAQGHAWVDLALLRQLHAAARAPGAA